MVLIINQDALETCIMQRLIRDHVLYRCATVPLTFDQKTWLAKGMRKGDCLEQYWTRQTPETRRGRIIVRFRDQLKVHTTVQDTATPLQWKCMMRYYTIFVPAFSVKLVLQRCGQSPSTVLTAELIKHSISTSGKCRLILALFPFGRLSVHHVTSF